MVTIETVKNIPPTEEWTLMMESSSPAEAIRLWQFAIECLHATNAQDQDGWGRHIGIAERVLRERGIDPYAHLPVRLLLNNPAKLTEVAEQLGMSVQAVKENHARLVKDGKARFDGYRFISLDEAGNDREPIIIDDSAD
jgi:hypothetical protein